METITTEQRSYCSYFLFPEVSFMARLQHIFFTLSSSTRTCVLSWKLRPQWDIGNEKETQGWLQNSETTGWLPDGRIAAAAGFLQHHAFPLEGEDLAEHRLKNPSAFLLTSLHLMPRSKSVTATYILVHLHSHGDKRGNLSRFQESKMNGLNLQGC